MPTVSAIRVDERPAEPIDEIDILELDSWLSVAEGSPVEFAPASPVGVAGVSRAGLIAKRALDLAVSMVALAVLAPLMLLIAVIVRLTSAGPALFLQERIGEDGRTFRMMKFRSMQSGTDDALASDEIAHRRYVKNGFKLAADDPHITGFGRFLRMTSLDELPQLFNVLVGDMSLVGIRPIVAEELASRSPYDQDCYCSMKPGMTGLWQVSGRSSLDTDERHALDRTYVETWTVWNDVRVLVRTPLAVLRIADTN